MIEISIRGNQKTDVKFAELLSDIYNLCTNHGMQILSVGFTSQNVTVSSSFCPTDTKGDVIDAEVIDDTKKEILLDEDIR